MVMPGKKESLEDTIRRVLGEEKAKQDADSELQELLKKNPVEGLRRLIRGEIDGARTRDIDAEDSSKKDDDDEGGDVGPLTAIFGGGRK